MIKYLHNVKKKMLFCAVIFFFAFVSSSNALLAYITPVKDISVPSLTILFTNDVHSSGDYARLAALIKQEREKATDDGSAVLVVDAGDIAMGSVYQTIYGEHAFEYVAMALMGYDAVTCGNHDFDFGLHYFTKMLDAAKNSLEVSALGGGASLPTFVVSNLDALHSPYFGELGIKDTLVLTKSVKVGDLTKNVSIGIYGLMGEHAYSCIAGSDSLRYSDRLEASKRAVSALQSEGVDYIISLSHGGTLWAKGKRVESGDKRAVKLKSFSEDGKLANSVVAPDVIISGHDHELLAEPLILKNTIIGSTGSKSAFLGKIVLAGDSLVEYSMLPVDTDILPDEEMNLYLERSYRKVVEKFRSECSVELDDTIAVVKKSLPCAIEPDGEMALGFYIADSYRAAVSEFEDAIAIVPYGVIRAGIREGVITNREAFDVLSLGMNSNNAPGFPLVIAWFTGKELYDVCELNPSVASGMEDVRLFFSGLEYEYNRHRIPFTRVTKVMVDGKPIDKKRLYPVVTGLYTAQLMGMLKSSSYGLLSVTPKNKMGEAITDFTELEIAEWSAFAEYIKRTKLNNPVKKYSTENSTLFIYLKYLLILALIVIPIIWLLRSGRRAHGRQP